MSFMFLFYLQTLDSNIWTHRHQAVKAHVRRKTNNGLQHLYNPLCAVESMCEDKSMMKADIYIIIKLQV